MPTEIYSEITLQVFADTRDGCISAMDEASIHFLDFVGGAPWVMIDDDINRVQSPLNVKDDQGFTYLGKRSYKYGGPFKNDLGIIEHDGMRLQKRITND
jgi:hypothetical protein